MRMEKLSSKRERKRIAIEIAMDDMFTKLKSSGIFSDAAIDSFLSMIRTIDDLFDIDIAVMFLKKDGEKNASKFTVNSIIDTLPMGDFVSALSICR